jgi:3D (Asp-Asp-Asp) domain-containing protein
MMQCVHRTRKQRRIVRRAVWSVLGVMILAAGGCARSPRPNTTIERPPGGLSFTATAYCAGSVTATGARPLNKKTIAADPTVLPMGSRIRLTRLGQSYDGVYVVNDTGARIRGRRIDLYIRDCDEAIRFGRRSATVSLLQR